MFAPRHDSPASLRQGDIIADTFFPLTRPPLLKFLGTYGSGSGVNIRLEPHVEIPLGSKKQYMQAMVHGIIAHGAVVSQCCDLDRKHPKTSFSLCRLIPFERHRYRNAEALVDNIDPWGPENPHFQFFYFGPVDGLQGDYLADFGWLTSFGWSDYDHVLGKKILQLDDLNRNKFRVKAGAFWSRPSEEDVQAGLSAPYGPAVPGAPGLLNRLRAFFRL
jgi:hypothetical protein